MLKLISLFTFSVLLSTQLSAQSINGIVKDDQGEPIAYATIYAPGAKTGTLTDDKGLFELSLDKIADTSKIQFSCIGFETQFLTFNELTNLPSPATIQLSPSNYLLETAEVSAERIKMKRSQLGMSGLMNGTYIYSDASRSGNREIGTLLTPDKRARLEEVIIKLRSMDADSVLMDINIYRVNFGRVGEPLLKERLFLNLSQDDVRKDISVDLSDQEIYVEEQFLVTFRILKVVGPLTNIKVSGKTGNGKGFGRVSGGQWQDTYLTPNIRAKVGYPKD